MGKLGQSFLGCLNSDTALEGGDHGPMSSWSSHHMIDPMEIENRFAVEDGMAFMDSIFEEPNEETLIQVDRVKVILEALPPREADFVELYYFKKLNQTSIAALFGVSQPTVCYRLQRAVARIQYLLQRPQVTKPAMVKDLTTLLRDPLDVRILVLMWETTCQSEVAKQLNVSQGLVRHRFIRSVGRMRDSARHAQYVTLFDHISRNLNILREVQRPAWDTRITHHID